MDIPYYQKVYNKYFLMNYNCILGKLISEHTSPITYFLESGNEKININQWLGKLVRISYAGEIYCIKCGKRTKTSFQQGYCYTCFTSAPETEECVFRPELCRAHEGIARDMEFAKAHCLIEHIVYLASVDHIKVGITRHTQIPYRWIDQGAEKTRIIARTPNRYLAGCIEVALKQYLPDKTNWRSMLTNKVEKEPSFDAIFDKVASVLPSDLLGYLSENEQVVDFQYPVNAYPQKVKSLDLEKQPDIEGKLSGIRGQYLIFEDGGVLNIRKFGGYKVSVNVE